jgi:uncharacterized Zn-finger protein
MKGSPKAAMTHDSEDHVEEEVLRTAACLPEPRSRGSALLDLKRGDLVERVDSDSKSGGTDGGEAHGAKVVDSDVEDSPGETASPGRATSPDTANPAKRPRPDLRLCETCGESMQTATKAPHVCVDCRQKFARDPSSMAAHVQDDASRPFLCKVCGKAFSSAENRSLHTRIHSMGGATTHAGTVQSGANFNFASAPRGSIRLQEGTTMCHTCGKTFTDPRLLEEHTRKHLAKPFPCSVCTKSFARSDHLAIHMRTHTGEQPFTCKTCGKTFTTSGNLATHVRTHTGEKPYVCETCGRAFTAFSTLGVHIRKHTGEKPHVCGVCGRAFAVSNNLSRHQRAAHGIVRPEKPTLRIGGVGGGSM